MVAVGGSLISPAAISTAREISRGGQFHEQGGETKCMNKVPIWDRQKNDLTEGQMDRGT